MKSGILTQLVFAELIVQNKTLIFFCDVFLYVYYAPRWATL